MSTKRELLLLKIGQTVAASVTGLTGVYRSREDALSREEAPAVVIGWTDEQLRGTGVIDFADKDLTVTVGVYTRGEAPDLVADPFCEQIYAALMGEPTLGGLALDIEDAGTNNETAAADSSAGWVEMQFRVWYRHSRASMSGNIVPNGALSIGEGWLMLSGGYLTIG